MHVEHLSLTDFRSYPTAEVPLGPGVTTLVGDNGQGKTNVVEALAYLATLGSHRVATDAALVRSGAERAVVRGRLRRGGRAALLELEITPGKANRARVNRSPTRPREVLGLLRTVVFAPEDLAVVKGEPDQRRRFVDDLLVALSPRYAGVRSDYERVVRQRSALLKSGRGLRGEARDGLMATLEVWDGQLAQTGADLLAARLRTLEQLAPYAEQAYADVSGVPGALTTAYRARGLHPGVRSEATAALPPPPSDRQELHDALLAAVAQARRRAGPRDHAGRPPPRRRRPRGQRAARPRLRQPRRVVVGGARAARGLVRPAARHRGRGRRARARPRRRVRRAGLPPPEAPGRPRPRRGAGRGHGRGGRGRPRRPGRPRAHRAPRPGDRAQRDHRRRPGPPGPDDPSRADLPPDARGVPGEEPALDGGDGDGGPA